jgi:1-deoxy-D-xylulose-5-phosphate synthase
VGALHDYLGNCAQAELRVSVQWSPSRWEWCRAALARVASRGAERQGVLAAQQERVIFEELGFTFLGPFDGHHIPPSRDLPQAKTLPRPVLIQVVTQKGGWEFAENDPTKFHGPVRTAETGELKKKPKAPIIRRCLGYARALAKRDPSIVGITAAMAEGTAQQAQRALPIAALTWASPEHA